MNAVFSWYLQNAVTTALLVPFVLLACRAFRERPAVQHALWVVVLLKLLMPPVVSWPWQLENLWQSAITFVVAPQVTPLMPAGADLIEAKTTSESELLVAGLMLLWLVGAVALTAHYLRKISRQARLIRGGTKAPHRLSRVAGEIARRWGLRPIPVLLVRGVSSPFLWCLGRLKLIWPQHRLVGELPPSVIAHELAHLRRRDHWIAWLELLGAALWWWNPVFWLVRKNLHATSEMACDALALATFPEGRCEYAETLLELSAVSQPGAPALVLRVSAGTPSSLERRMSMIVSERVSGKLSLTGICLAGLLALVALPAWTYGQDSDEKADAKKLQTLLKLKKLHEAEARQKSPAEAEHLVAVLHKLALAAHQGDEDAAKKLALIHHKLQAAMKQTGDGIDFVVPDKAAKMENNVQLEWKKKLQADHEAHADAARALHDELTKAYHADMAKAVLAQKAAKAAQIDKQSVVKYNELAKHHAQILLEYAADAKKSDLDAAKKAAQLELEFSNKKQDDTGRANADLHAVLRGQQKLELLRKNQDEAAQRDVEADIKRMEADLKKLKLQRIKLEEARKKTDPSKP